MLFFCMQRMCLVWRSDVSWHLLSEVAQPSYRFTAQKPEFFLGIFWNQFPSFHIIQVSPYPVSFDIRHFQKAIPSSLFLKDIYNRPSLGIIPRSISAVMKPWILIQSAHFYEPCYVWDRNYFVNINSYSFIFLLFSWCCAWSGKSLKDPWGP